MKLPELGVKRPTTTLMIFSALILFGVVMLARLDRDIMPDIELPSITVITVYPGASAEDVEEQVTKPLEEHLASIPDLNRLTSSSKENVSFVMLEFDWGTDLTESANDTRDRIDQAKKYLADDAEDPLLIKIDASMMPVLVYGINAEESYSALDNIIDDKINNRLKKINGVGSVVTLGQPEREIQVNVDPYKLQAYGFSPGMIAVVLQAENINIPGGNIKTGVYDFSVRIPGKFEDVSEIGNLVVSNRRGRTVRLKDIASIVDSFKEKDETFRSNGVKAATIMVQKQSGANSLKVARAIQAEVRDIIPTLPVDVKITELIDSSELVTLSIKNLTETIFWAGLFVVIVVVIFLRDLRSSLIVGLTIPFALIGTFGFMKVFGYTLNIVSEMALTITIGMVVDNAIVVLENITKHIERNARPKEAAIFGTDEMAGAISASTLTTIAVFLPLLMVTGLTGIMFDQLAILASITLLVSLFTALTLTPMLSSKLLKPAALNQRNKKRRWDQIFEKMFVTIENVYARALEWSVQHKLITVLAMAVLLCASVGAAFMIGSDYMPEFDAGDVRVVYQLEQGTRVEETERITLQVEEIVKAAVAEIGKSGDIRAYFSMTGQSESGLLTMIGFDEGKNIGTVIARLVVPEERDYSSQAVADNIDKRLRTVPEIIKYKVTGGSLLGTVLTGSKQPLEIMITGENLDRMSALAEEIDSRLKQSRLLTGIENTVDQGKNEIMIIINREKAGDMGLRAGQIAMAIRSAVYGSDAGEYLEEGEEYEINVRFEQAYRRDLKYLNDITLPTPNGLVTLSQVARIVEKTGPLEILRESQQRVVYIKVDMVEGVDLGRAVIEVRNVLAGIEIPEDIDVELVGQYEDRENDMKSLKWAFVIGIILVFMVMASRFESLVDPFIIMFSVPLAIIGVIWAFVLTGTTLSVVSAIGVIMLVGIVVNNGIVLVDYINLLRARGRNLFQAAVEAGHSRLRPVLMTALTTIFAMVPMAYSSGMGSEMWSPIGITVIGGLLAATIITLIVIPVMYVSIYHRADRLGQGCQMPSEGDLK